MKDIEIGSSSIFIAAIDYFQKYAEISNPSPNHLISHLYTRAITYVICNDKIIFKKYFYTLLLNQAHGLWPCTPGFLKLLWFVRWYVCVYVCVCVSAPEAINN